MVTNSNEFSFAAAGNDLAKYDITITLNPSGDETSLPFEDGSFAVYVGMHGDSPDEPGKGRIVQFKDAETLIASQETLEEDLTGGGIRAHYFHDAEHHHLRVDQLSEEGLGSYLDGVARGATEQYLKASDNLGNSEAAQAYLEGPVHARIINELTAPSEYELDASGTESEGLQITATREDYGLINEGIEAMLGLTQTGDAPLNITKGLNEAAARIESSQYIETHIATLRQEISNLDNDSSLKSEQGRILDELGTAPVVNEELETVAELAAAR